VLFKSFRCLPSVHVKIEVYGLFNYQLKCHFCVFSCLALIMLERPIHTNKHTEIHRQK